MGRQLRSIAMAVTALLAFAGIGIGAYAYAQGVPPFGQTDDQWSGVFLTNGQAYFGHFSSGPGDYARLREVYYVLATQLQSQDPSKPASTQLSLQRLGGEVHGPRTDMQISKQQILFVEELRADSPLVAAISQLKSGGAPAPQPQPAGAPANSAPAGSPSAPPSGSPISSATATPTRTGSPSPSPTR